MAASKFSKTARKFIYTHKSKFYFSINLICVALLVILFIVNDAEREVILYTGIAGGLNLLMCVIIFLTGTKTKKVKNNSNIIENVMLDFIYNLNFPVIITDRRGYILWSNNTMFEFVDEDDMSRKSISAITRNNISTDRLEDIEDGIVIELKENIFNVKYYKLNSYENELYLFTFEDITAFEGMKTEFALKDPVIAYFVIDNLDEVLQKMQDKYRMASGSVSYLMQDIMAKCGGLIKEYERDKYLCVFEAKTLKNFVKSKFGSILDVVREIKIEDANISVTMSGGISNIEGTLFEKDAAARQALDVALQRGGDQIVVKGVTSTEYYGGRTKTVQKRTNVRSRVVANELEMLMKTSSNVLIMGHRFADNDSIGACIGIARLAASINCKPHIIVNIHDKNLKSTFNKLRGIEEYRDMFQDEATALDMITSETLLVVVDVNNPKRFESQAIYDNVYKTVLIDHHRKTGEFTKEPDILYIEPSASSTSELVAEMLEQVLSPGELLKEEAELLLAGIILDTQQFSKDTGIRTFSAALYLRGEGGNPTNAVSIFKTDLEEFTKEAKFESNIVIYRNVIGIAACETSVLPTDTVAGAKAANRILTIDGVSASFVIYKIENTVYISARSLGNINVQIILESFGGGGHFDAAGAQIRNTTIKEVVSMLKKTIDEYFDIV